ncbi:sensor histidine kinase [Paenibacillus sambharensis]|nr:sensor histidine kinase [Paenibacillus sambharensis]
MGLLEWMKRSLRTKLIVFLIIAITVPMLLSIYLTNSRTTEIVTEDALQQASNLVFQGKTNLIHYFDVTNQASLLPYNDTKFGDTLYRILERGKTDYLSEEEIYRTIQSISRSVREIRQVYLHAEMAEKGYLIIQGNLKKAEQSAPHEGVTFPEDRNVSVQAAHKSHEYGIHTNPYYPPEEVITIHRRIIRIPSYKQIGTISIDLKKDVVDSICSQLYDPSKEQLYLLSEDGSIVYGPQGAESGAILNEPWVKTLTEAGGPSGTGRTGSSSTSSWYVYEKLETSYMNWTLVKLIPQSVLTESTRQVTFVNTVILTIFLLAAIAAAVYVSFRITRPMKHLIRYINQVQTGDLDVDIRIQGTDEIGMLAGKFRKMMETINNLILREYRLQLASKSNQLRALQAQIQPHFLYNALQSIGTLALQHQAPKVYTLIAQLAKMMRYSMSTSDQPVTVHDELEHVKAYLALQQQRFGDKVTVQYDIQDKAAAVKVPRMLVQPLVENAFKHGFDPAGGRIHISITARIIGDLLQLTVEDDGPGMTERRLGQVRDALRIARVNEHEQWLDEHIGLVNVMTRMRLYSGPEADIMLEQPGNYEKGAGGLRVILQLPGSKEEQE